MADKIIRYSIPFIIAFCIEEIPVFLYDKKALSLDIVFSLLLTFLQGGSGPGSYYYPIMIQFVFLFPIIFFILKKYKFKGVVICGIVNAVYELLKRAYGMNEGYYRLLLFRYILLIAIGCYLTSDDFRINIKAAFLSCLIGISFIIG